MAYDNVMFDLEDGVGVLTFNRPKVLNALDAKTIAELGEVVARAESDRSVKALILTGAGEKAFVAGADIAAMSAMSTLDARRFAETAHAILARMEALPIVTIAAVNGFALGGGCELAMACDLVYASEKARFGQPEVNLGLIPGFGGSQRLARRVGLMRAKELVFTGDMVDAQKAKAIGLSLNVLPPDGLFPLAIHVAQPIRRAARHAR